MVKVLYVEVRMGVCNFCSVLDGGPVVVPRWVYLQSVLPWILSVCHFSDKSN